MIIRTERKSAAKQSNDESEINTITGIVCTVNNEVNRDKARSLVQHYYRKGVRDVSQIGFMILLSPERAVKLPVDRRLGY
jgi:hypothetical protein